MSTAPHLPRLPGDPVLGRLARIEEKVDDVALKVAHIEGRFAAGGPSDEPKGWDRLAKWAADWSPWQVLVAIALMVGGPTVAGPAVDRVLSVMLPPVVVEQPARPAPAAMPEGNDDAALLDTADDLRPRPMP